MNSRLFFIFICFLLERNFATILGKNKSEKLSDNLICTLKDNEDFFGNFYINNEYLFDFTFNEKFENEDSIYIQHDNNITIRSGNNVWKLEYFFRIKIPLDKLYRSSRNTIIKSLSFYSCLWTNIFVDKSNKLSFSTNRTKKKRKNYKFECTLEFCNLSTFVNIGYSEMVVENETNYKFIEKSFQLYFQSDKSNNVILFHRIKRGHNMYPLVPCPYKNWMYNYQTIYFKPAEYVKEEFPEIAVDKNRHRYIPAFKREETELGDGFICGEIIQGPMLPSIKVGFGIEQGSSMDVGLLNITKNKYQEEEFFCKNIDLESKYIFAFLSKKYNNQFQKDTLRLIKIEDKIYSGELLFIYSQAEILTARFKGYNNSKDYDDLYYNKEYTGYHPIAACRVEDFEAEFRLKIDDVFQKPIKSNKKITLENESYDTYKITNDLIKNKQFISCQIVKSGNDTRYHENFYSKRFKTYIQKIQNSAGHDQLGSKHEKIEIRNDMYEMLGKYKCSINDSEDFKKIKTTYIIIVSPENNTFKFTHSFYKNTESPFTCSLKDIKLDDLVEMNVTVNGLKHVSLNVKNLHNNHRFKKDKSGNIVYHPIADISIYHNFMTTVKCVYGNTDITKIIIEKSIDFYGNTADAWESNSLLRNTVFGWIAFMLFVVLIVIINTILKVIKRDKKRFSGNESNSRTITESTSAKKDTSTKQKTTNSVTTSFKETETTQRSLTPTNTKTLYKENDFFGNM